MTHLDFKRLTTEWWKEFEDPEGSRMYAFQQKLKYIKTNLKTWNKESFGNIMEERLWLEATIGEIKVWVMRDGYIKEDGTKE